MIFVGSLSLLGVGRAAQHTGGGEAGPGTTPVCCAAPPTPKRGLGLFDPKSECRANARRSGQASWWDLSLSLWSVVRRVNSGGECGAPPGVGGRKARRQGCLGRRSSPGTWLFPRSLPPRAPLAPCFHPPETLHRPDKTGRTRWSRRGGEGDERPPAASEGQGEGRRPGRPLGRDALALALAAASLWCGRPDHTTRRSCRGGAGGNERPAGRRREASGEGSGRRAAGGRRDGAAQREEPAEEQGGGEGAGEPRAGRH